MRMTWVIVGIALLTVACLDLAVWTNHNIAVLYTIPLAISALYLSPRAVGAIACMAIGLDVYDIYLARPTIDIWLVGLVSLVIVSYLALRLSFQRVELARRTREAEGSRHQLQEFMGMVVHDLRGPLTVVHGYNQLLRHRLGSDGNGATQQTLERMDSSIGRMQRLLSDLQDAAEIGAGRFDIRPEVLDLQTLVQQTVDELRETSAGHDFRIDGPEQLKGCWDRQRICQVLNNLISNAVKYSPEGGDVTIVARRSGSNAIVSVQDHGLGIAEDRQAELFRPFSRVGDTHVAKGMGLGLFITKGIVEAHGGQIWVESKLGQGSTFSVALPIDDVAVATGQGCGSSSHAPESGRTSQARSV